jgi:hypothetical protein
MKAKNTVPEDWNTERPWDLKSVRPTNGQQLRLFWMSKFVSNLKVFLMMNIYPRFTSKRHPTANKRRLNAAWQMPNL